MSTNFGHLRSFDSLTIDRSLSNRQHEQQLRIVSGRPHRCTITAQANANAFFAICGFRDSKEAFYLSNGNTATRAESKRPAHRLTSWDL
jgi:hypothetical protein